jgi:hypothetical protein
MAISLPNGALVSIAASYAAAANITAISNASSAVVTAANTLTAGDYVEITSGWSRLSGKVVRVSSATSSTFTLDGYDTSLTSIYPAGGGVGSFRKILTWTQLSQILSSSSSGGEQQFLEYQLLEGDAQKRIPTVKSAAGLTFSVADDPLLPGYILVSAANDDRLPRGARIDLPSGAKILYNAYMSLNKTPSLEVNAIMAVEVTLSLLAEPVRYSV